MFYGFVITEAGNNLLAKMVAGDKLTITKVVMDKGTAESVETARKLTAPIDPGPSGTSTVPTVEGAAVNMLVEYRSDLNGGLQEGFWIGGFAVFGKVENGAESMIYYGSLGERKQYVSAYVEGTAPDVRRYPVSITVTAGVEVEVSYPAEAWMTAEDVAQYISGMGLDGDGYLHGDRTLYWMGQACPGGPLKLDNIRGNTILGGTPAYDAPVSMESVEGPLRLHVAGKNLIDFSIIPNNVITQYGVTCTIADGKFELTGTSDRPGGSYTYIFPYGGAGDTTKFYLPPGEYWLSGMSADQPNRLISLYINVYPDQISSSAEFNVHANLVAGTGFTLNSGKWITVNVLIQNGVTTDGVVIRPQIEVGSAATENEGPTAKTIEIPLIGIDGRTLDPLRSAYGGGTYDVELPLYTDKIIRLDGVWCVERNTTQVELTAASWNKAASYMTPYLSGRSINPGVKTNNPICTHFVGRGRSQSFSAGAWVGSLFVIGNDVLPSGANTTEEELAAFCVAQNEAGTPVRVCLPMAPPVYEKLHQDVQLLLNTLAVPGGVCSVWFEGDVPPSNADIGLPRGDYPSAGLEGAYRWLEELSNPLPAPTGSDLYAWALEQQRGGVFATSGSTTTQNVPEAGNLTGILSVTEQGSVVSMIVFGPTGKIHTAIRIAGVWRGWTTLYSPLSKPSPADLGAAAASHDHSTDQITSGVLPMERGGLGADTWSAALDNLRGLSKQATYYPGSSEVDIDTITDGLTLVPMAASKGCPVGGSFVFILQLFYGDVDASSNRTQIAIPYHGGNGIAVRTYNGSVWREWNLVYTAKTPPPAMTGATASAAGASGLVPAPAAGAQGKYLRGDGTWQTPYTHPSYTARSSGLYKITVDGSGHISGAESTHTGRAARFVIGTSAAGWTAEDCDYLCDGTADDVEIKAAISALPSRGGEILLLDGTYNISSSIAISKANVTLRGSGASTVLTRKFNGTSSNGVIGCSAASCRICDLTIDGNKSAYTSGNNRGVYASMSAANIKIDHITVKNAYTGIALSGMTGGSISDCIVQTTSAHGIYISGASSVVLDGNTISGNGGNGITVESTEGIQIRDNNISVILDSGIYVDSASKRGVISGNVIAEPNDDYSIYLSGTGVVITDNVTGRILLGSGSKSNIAAHNISSQSVSNSGTDNVVDGNTVYTEEVTA